MRNTNEPTRHDVALILTLALENISPSNRILEGLFSAESSLAKVINPVLAITQGRHNRGEWENAGFELSNEKIRQKGKLRQAEDYHVKDWDEMKERLANLSRAIQDTQQTLQAHAEELFDDPTRLQSTDLQILYTALLSSGSGLEQPDYKNVASNLANLSPRLHPIRHLWTWWELSNHLRDLKLHPVHINMLLGVHYSGGLEISLDRTREGYRLISLIVVRL